MHGLIHRDLTRFNQLGELGPAMVGKLTGEKAVQALGLVSDEPHSYNFTRPRGNQAATLVKEETLPTRKPVNHNIMSCGMSRSSLLAGLLCLGVGASAQDRAITLSLPASRASVVLDEIGKQAGIPLSVTNKLADNAVILNVKNVPFNELLQRLSTALNGEWTKKGYGYDLVTSSSLDLKAQRAHLQYDADRIDKYLLHQSQRLAKQPAFDQAAAEKLAEAQDAMARGMNGEGGFTVPVSNSENDPAGRLFAAMATVLGADSLATVPENGRVVFSTQPNQMQKNLPPRVTDVVRTYLREQKMVQSARKEATNTIENRRIVMTSGALQTGNGNPDLGVGRVMLAVARSRGMLHFDIYIDDPNGASIAHGRSPMVINLGPTPEATPASKDEHIPLSPLAAEFAKMTTERSLATPGNFRRVAIVTVNTFGFTSTPPGAEAPPVSAELKARVLDPLKYDPQSLGPTEAFQAAAKARQENLLAVLPDSAILPLNRSLAKGVSVADFLATSAPLAGITVREADGWLTATAADPTAVMSSHVHRPALRKVLQALDTKQTVPLEDLVNFAVRQPKVVDTAGYDGFAMRLVNPSGATDALNTLSDPDMLRFYNALSAEQRKRLANGGKYRVGDLGNAVEYLSRMYYQSTGGPFMFSTPGIGYTTRNAIGSLEQNERTLLLPNGIPSDTVVAMQFQRQPVALCYDKFGGSIVNPLSLASRLYAAESPAFAQFETGGKIERYVNGNQDVFDFQFTFLPNLSMNRTLTDTSLDDPKGGGGYDSLPAAFRAQTDQTLAKMRSSLSGMKIQFAGPRPVPAKP